MEIRKILVADIKMAKYNPRKELQPEDAEYQALDKCITEFGLVQPLVWNKRSGNLVGGHQRLRVLLAKGVKEVDVSVVDLSPEKEKALNLALNKIQGRWDEAKLAAILDELTKIPDFDVGLTGFNDVEVSHLLDSLLDEENEDIVPDINLDQKAITQTGDLICLGQHRILCGDSGKIEDVFKLLNNNRADMGLTDIPYNADYLSSNRPNAGKKSPWKKIQHDNMKQPEYEFWLKNIFVNMKQVLQPGAPVYIWNGHRQFGPMHQMLIELEFHVSCVITWVKERFALGFGDYNHQSEFCLYGWLKENGPHRWYGEANESTVWQVKRDLSKDYIHPTQKPVELAKRAIKNSSIRGNIVLDLFLGSGSTLIAAESMQRICYGIEIDPLYCDAIVRRYINHVGKDKVSSDILERYN